MLGQRFEFTAKVEVLLANGETVKRTLFDHIRSTNHNTAAREVKDVIRQTVYDWDGDDVDAPVEEILHISAIRFIAR